MIPLLACFAGSASRELETIVYLVVVCWIGTLAVGGVNFVLICLTGDSGFKAVHFGWFGGYALAVMAMFGGMLTDGFIIAVALGLGVPIAVGIHFVALLRARRRLAKIERRTRFEV